MLEVFAIMMLCKANKKNALARGRRPGGYIALTIILWVGLELVGAFIGAAMGFEGYGIIVPMYGLAGLGALISFLCAKFGPKGNYVDPNAQTSNPSLGTEPALGTYNVPVNTPAYMINPNQPAQPQEYVQVPNPYQAPAQPVQQEKITYCEFCGTPNKGGSKFCSSCGSKLDQGNPDFE